MPDLEKHIIELLHIEELNKNKLMDLYGTGASTYLLYKLDEPDNRRVVSTILSLMQAGRREGIEQMSTLRGSATQGARLTVDSGYENAFDWRRADGDTSPHELDAFIEKLYREDIGAKGNNPLFLSIGAVRWQLIRSTGDVFSLTSPLLIFPVQPIRLGAQSSVSIKYVEDEVYVNPCLYHALKQHFGEEAVRNFPLPDGCRTADDPVDVLKLNADAYLAAMESYLAELQKQYENTAGMALLPDLVAVSAYRHSDYCMYYDIRRNMARVKSSELISRVFGELPPCPPADKTDAPTLILPYDKPQQDIIGRVVNGDSLVIQGPPGSGKTHTIVNIIAALMAQGKRVLFVSTKIPALTEVYKKMPEELRRYLLPLFTEGEQGTVSSSEVKDLHASLADAYRTETERGVSSPEKDRVTRMRSASLEALSRHYSLLFEDGKLLGRSVYETLDEYYAHPDITPVPHLTREELAHLTWQGCNEAEEAVNTASVAYDAITRHGARPFTDCAWISLREDACDYDMVSRELGDPLDRLTAAAEDLLRMAGDTPLMHAIPLNLLTHLSGIDLTDDLLQMVTEDPLADSHRAALADIYPAYRAAHRRIDAALRGGVRADLTEEITVPDCVVRDDLPVALIANIAAHPLTERLMTPAALPFFPTVFEAANDYAARDRAATTARTAALRIFSPACVEEPRNAKPLAAALKDLEKCRKKDKAFALSGKSLVQLRLFSHRTDVTDAELTDAVTQLYTYHETLPMLDDCLANVNRKLKANGIPLVLTAEELVWLSGVRLALEKSSATPVVDLFRTASAAWTGIRCVTEALGVTDPTPLTAASLYALVADCNLLFRLNRAVLDIKRDLETEDPTPAPLFARSYLAVGEMARYLAEEGVAKNDIPASVLSLTQHAKALEQQHGFAALCRKTRLFLVEHTEESSPLRAVAARLSHDRLVALREDLSDPTLAEHARLFRNSIDGVASMDLMRFFLPFITGARQDHLTHTLPVIFRHSLIAQVLRAVIRPEPGYRHTLDEAAKAEEELLAQNVRAIAAACSASVPRGQAYDFLSTKCKYRYLRSYFKDKAEEILSLKRCLIMSPSAVSILLRGNAYMSFDVLILDEASQVPPSYALPPMLRAKQCVLVGDIYQMPYIRSFVSRRTGTEDLADEYERVDSVLDLVNRHESFPSYMLGCHFRSHTESLIAYSQRRYYRDMLTFPAPDPLGDGKGFRDIRVDGSTIRRRGVSSAENRVEAKQVVELLSRHFEAYYDPEEKRLRRSVGVIAFGEKQVSLIRSLIDATPDLAAAVRAMESEGVVNAERHFFLKAIQRAQGMETDDLILSMTYGRIYDEDKDTFVLNSHWGELNRDFGEKIFNVAVTRGRKSVTVIHSVDAEELPDGLGYIREYLVMLRDFVRTQASDAGFVSRRLNNRFVTNVADTLAAHGIPRERMILGYGVTENSYTIPIAILSQDKTRAEAGILCEVPPPPKQSYLDYVVRYPHILAGRGWQGAGEERLIRLPITEWFLNPEEATATILQALKKLQVN